MFGREQVHTAAPAARTPRDATEEFGHHLLGRDPLGERVTVAAVSTEDDVFISQMRTHTDRDRFLADVGVTRPVDQTALVTPRQRLFRVADE